METEELIQPLVVTQKKRVFKYDEVELPDPGAEMKPEEVIEFYSPQYPELACGYVKDQEDEDDKIIYNIETNIGGKG